MNLKVPVLDWGYFFPIIRVGVAKELTSGLRERNDLGSLFPYFVISVRFCV